MTTKKNYKKPCYSQNRELSWLRFNDRVLDEVSDSTVPLFERLKFISIFTSNLDEFFMIRVGSLTDLEKAAPNSIDKKSGMTASEQLAAIYEAVRPLYIKRELAFSEINSKLQQYGIYRLTYIKLTLDDKLFIDSYFNNEVAPFLSPLIIDAHHPFPHIPNKNVYIGASLRRKGKTKIVFALIPLPSNLNDILYLPGEDLRYMPLKEVLLAHIQDIFTSYDILEKTSFCITRNADINPDDEAFDFGNDFRKKMKKVISIRRKMAPVRLECSTNISGSLKDFLCANLNISDNQIFITDAPLKMDYVFAIPDKLDPEETSALLYNKFLPAIPSYLQHGEAMTRQIQKHDILLSYPYESMEPFLRLIFESATDPNVISIKITIYRLAKMAKLIDYLCLAAENGKEVTTLIELRARFDEKSNIDWSERLEDAGCTIIYGLEDYKVHSKVCLITRKERGRIKYITQIGTGNYNENTATMYTDFSLMTADDTIGHDANVFFKNMSIGNIEGEYNDLIVAPSSLKSKLMSLFDEEIAQGHNGKIVIKINSLTDFEIINKIKEASCAGVSVRMIVRGICCILPGIEGKTENLEIISIVGRFLEHSRVYCFGSGTKEVMYIGSADFMTRNTERRVEVACLIKDSDIKSKIDKMLDICFHDTIKARRLCKDGSYRKITDGVTLDSQKFLLENTAFQDACENPYANSSRESSINPFHKIHDFIDKIL